VRSHAPPPGGSRGTGSAPLDEADLAESFVKGGGPGGQKINKVRSAVQLLHVPTGLRVQCQRTRSLELNRKIARRELRLKVDEKLRGAESVLARRAAARRGKKRRTEARARRRRAAREGRAAAASPREARSPKGPDEPAG
jgi:protein subunit release factor B